MSCCDYVARMSAAVCNQTEAINMIGLVEALVKKGLITWDDLQESCRSLSDPERDRACLERIRDNLLQEISTSEAKTLGEIKVELDDIIEPPAIREARKAVAAGYQP